MKRFIKDCNFDDRITCSDFALTHKASPNHHECSKPWIRDTRFWRKFSECRDALGLL